MLLRCTTPRILRNRQKKERFVLQKGRASDPESSARGTHTATLVGLLQKKPQALSPLASGVRVHEDSSHASHASRWQCPILLHFTGAKRPRMQRIARLWHCCMMLSHIRDKWGSPQLTSIQRWGVGHAGRCCTLGQFHWLPCVLYARILLPWGTHMCLYQCCCFTCLHWPQNLSSCAPVSLARTNYRVPKYHHSACCTLTPTRCPSIACRRDCCTRSLLSRRDEWIQELQNIPRGRLSRCPWDSLVSGCTYMHPAEAISCR